jgi:putative tributyrin esterase
MALCRVNFFGNSIGKMSAMDVVVPENHAGPLPVLYLLHGHSDDQTAWQRRTSIERYVEGMPLIVVMPDGARSFYCNDDRPGGMRYEDHIAKDVVEFVDRTFHTVAKPKGRAIAGLSMGGYGAIMLGLKHPDLYSVACGHSSAVGWASRQFKWRPELQACLAGVTPSRYDIFALSRKFRKSGRKLALRLDCGTEDFLLEQNRKFHRHLEKLDFAHEYAEYPGTHCWEYWDEHIRQTIAFVSQRVG